MGERLRGMREGMSSSSAPLRSAEGSVTAQDKRVGLESDGEKRYATEVDAHRDVLGMETSRM